MLDRYENVRKLSEDICRPLHTEDYVVQPAADVSPPKWHLGHTTWFFEAFILKPFKRSYRDFNPDYSFVFNSYYEAAGKRVLRPDRGNLSRPTVEEVFSYRKYVDQQIAELLSEGPPGAALEKMIELGLNHEQQHQELLWADIKYILGHNPLFPTYSGASGAKNLPEEKEQAWIRVEEGIYGIGHRGNSFCYDNELAPHNVLLNKYDISSKLVSNGEFLEFMEQGGYTDFSFWHSDGWDWVNQYGIKAPLYWHKINDVWHHYTLGGLRRVNPEGTLCHISYYEAAAYAAWKGCRLPTEFEWETAAGRFSWGRRWEWTESAYLPYPGFTKAGGAIREYNGKFMVNQKVLRGASGFTSPQHSRKTYRNFFHPHQRWQFTGIRLAR